MGYRETLAADWTTRDRLAVILIALTVAFMTGATLLVVSADAQMTTMTTQYGSNASIDYYDNSAVATGNASGDAVVFPLATTTVDGTPVTVVGVPADVTDRLPTMQLVPPPERGVAIPNRTGQRQFHGTDETLNLTVHDAGNDVFPRTWYRASSETVDRLGATGALVVTPSDEAVPETGAPTRAVLSFFRTGFRQIQGAVTLVVAGAGVLVAITVFSVTTASVVARRRTIGVLRTTGGTLRTVLGVFGLRALLLTTAGVLVGYALGVIGTNLVVNVSVYLGVPTSLSMHVTDRVLTLLVPAYLAIVGLGVFCGVLAAWRAVDRTPSGLLRSPAASKGRWLSVLDWRALAPTTAALMVFVVCALLLWSAGAAASPVVDSEGTTVVQQNAPNPLVSTVPVEYATVLQSADVAASPEIVAFSVLDGRPFLTRGADYSDFSAVADTRIVDGRPPNASDEAVVGTALASTLDLEPGDTIALGGSTYTAVSRVTVVGTFSGPGAVDDQLVVSLPVARTLTGLPDGTVQFVRTDRVPDSSDRGVTTLG
ncbi:MAG: FtsX-like permease family protein, partial [Halapricum sp.]